jgi:hypothetical protein
MIETSIFDTLKTLVSNRCYPLQMPQNPTFPAIVYTRIANTPINVLEGRPTIDQVRVQIDCYAKTYTAAKTLYSSVRSAMESATFKATLQTDDDFFEAETDLYRVSLDYYIWERV